jgi:hypothetical protein
MLNTEKKEDEEKTKQDEGVLTRGAHRGADLTAEVRLVCCL